MRRTPLSTALTLLVAALIAGSYGVAAGGGEGHPDVDPAVTCDGCHRETTPAVVAEWFTGAHGQNNVKCFVCHGTTGDDFVRVPEATRCIGCHAERVPADPESTAARCFTCHPGHLLSPHVAPATEPEGGQP